MTIETLIEKLQEDISWLGYNATEREIIEHIKRAITLLKEQGSEENRILKIVWDVLHSTVSVDTEADQDYVYELIRNQVRPMY